MALELRQMRYFVAVAEEGQLARAAHRLSMAQPALSQAIAQLELQVGLKLLERHARLTFVPPEAAGLEVQPLGDYPLVVVMAADHRLGRCPSCGWQTCSTRPFAADASASPDWIGFWTLDQYRDGPPRTTVAPAVTLAETAAILASGRAISVTPAVVAAPFDAMGIVSVPLIDAAPAVLALICRTSRNPLVETLATVARELSRPGETCGG